MVNGDTLKEFYKDKSRVNKEYHNRMMAFKTGELSVDEIWDRYETIRDTLEEKYGLLNFANRELYIDREFIGNFNSIVGKRGKVRMLFEELISYYNCFYRFDWNRPSESYIIFPSNCTIEIYEVLEDIK